MRRALLLLVVAFVLIAFAFSLVVPPFETPDEPFHYAFARHLAQGNGLPVQSAEGSGPWAQEGSQAPLYYALAGLLTRPIPQEDFADLAVRNPRANIGDPLYPGNKNFMLYSGADRPLTGSNLALHVGRWLSLLLGVATVLCTYALARLAFAADRVLPLLAAALVAAVPQFGFLSGSLTNDALVTAVAAATLYWLARLLVKNAATPVRPAEWLVLGLLLAAAALSKLQGLGLFLLAALAGLAMAFQRRDWGLPLRALLPVALPPALLAGWWYVRNLRLYGDWTGLSHLLELNGRRAGEFDLADWWLEFRGLRYSFWGLFGWFNILLPAWVYAVLDVVSVLAFVGALLALLVSWRTLRSPEQQAQRRVRLLALGWALLSFGLLVYWTLQATGSQGRLLFPALSALALLFVLGIDFWLALLPPRARGVARALVWAPLLALLAGVSLYALAVLLPRSYRPDPPVAALPEDAAPLSLTYATGAPIDLLGIAIPEENYRPGDDVPITLYLRSDDPQEADYQLFLQLLDERGAEVANVTTHPGWGRNPTTLWQPGAIYADRYLLRVVGPIDHHAPLLARVYTGFIDPATAEGGNLPLPARNAAGQEVTPFVAQVALRPHAPPTADALGLTPHGALLGGVVRIAAAGLPGEYSLQEGGALTVTVLYEATATPATDYTAFVHLIGTDGAQAAGFDRAPAEGRFPTRAWRAGDAIVADYPLTLPPGTAPGDYTLWTGLYETASGGALRLPLTDAAGHPSGDGQVSLGTLRVVP